jgi:hypothetical protein
MAWINTVKTSDGFDYTIGKMVIAHAAWVKIDGVWHVHLTHMAPDGAALHACVMPLKEVTKYLHALTNEKQRAL